MCLYLGYYRFQDIAAYWSKIATPLYLGVKPSDLRNDPWCGKTRMMGLSDGVRISMMFSRFDKIHACNRRTSRQTDRWTELPYQ